MAVKQWLDWLRKLGILRFGGEAAVYHNAKERPISFQMDDVFDSQKDILVNGNRNDDVPPSTAKPS